jgi:hypothetical protein
MDWRLDEMDDLKEGDKSDQNLKRIKIESMDMEWVFIGNNASCLLSILAN